MFIRIVKLTFKKENIASFEQLFDQTKQQIRNFDGCLFLELYKDKNNEGIFFTYSKWESTDHLEKYRNSEFFKKVWSQTKPMFREKAEAWSVDPVKTLI
ncbi:putative quinol monooxygenase [Zeaxanthinibacter sp. PT1]|uniref:putative quinol monooxygenase n=1 Tax=Zeaxanthinibacter TaxID=561554 RepID=UPI00234AC36E|nr:putative quinol monooxygenase [Zeaxanthinibacter sp. PT1]MDC6351320.1 putative quinol monooxygenase [Zeaxanthinibacter sp. PT1]